MYEASLQIESSKLLAGKLCKALTDIGTVCVKHLGECFARDDVIQMKRSSLAEMKDFLIRIVNGKVKEDALDDCKAGLDAVDTLEEYDDEEYDEPQVVLQGESGNDEEAAELISENEEADKSKNEEGDAATGGNVGGGKEHRSVGQVDEVTTKVDEVTTKVDEVGEVKKENKVEESEEARMVEGKEEAVRRVKGPEKIRNRSGSSTRLNVPAILLLLLVPVFLNL